MPSRVDRFFSAEDVAEIQRAVVEAEARTAGEIVPYAVDASDDYHGAEWTAAALGALAGPLIAAAVHAAAGLWGGWLPLWLLLPPLAGAAGGYLLALVPALRRRLVPAAVAERRVAARAAQAFVSEEVFATRERTGVLIFVSLFERRVVVLADAGIHSRVAAGEWDRLVAGIVAGVRAGRPGSALADAIRRCGELLAEHGVARRPDDVDELSDGLHREER
jgi:putative membrane protein